MGALFVYILKSSVCLTLLYLFYKLLLCRETFYRFNRMALLGILILSLVVPFCEPVILKPVQIHSAINSLELLMLQPGENNTSIVGAIDSEFNWVVIILQGYCAGIIFFFLRSCYSLLQVLLLVRKAKIEKLKSGISLAVHEQNIAPFSWMKFIVVSEKDMAENRKEILQHELGHIKHRHSIDLLLAEVYIFFQWFNPAAWLMKQELQTIHEYQADNSVLRSGIDVKTYQLLLIKKAAGTLRFNSMANSFNHSKLKKRITMMLKEKSNPWARLKYLYVLPLLVITIAAFARPEISDQLNEVSKAKIKQSTSLLEVLEDSTDSISVSNAASGEPGDVKMNTIAVNVQAKANGEVAAHGQSGSSDSIKILILNENNSLSQGKPAIAYAYALNDETDSSSREKGITTYFFEFDNSAKQANTNRYVGEASLFYEIGSDGNISVTSGNDAFDNMRTITIDGKESTPDDLKKLKASKIEHISLKMEGSATGIGADARKGTIKITTKK